MAVVLEVNISIMTLARQRQDLLEQDLRIPVRYRNKIEHIEIGGWFPCRQPKWLENKEYNVVMDIMGLRVYVMSIDLEFSQVE